MNDLLNQNFRLLSRCGTKSKATIHVVEFVDLYDQGRSERAKSLKLLTPANISLPILANQAIKDPLLPPAYICINQATTVQESSPTEHAKEKTYKRLQSAPRFFRPSKKNKFRCSSGPF